MKGLSVSVLVLGKGEAESSPHLLNLQPYLASHTEPYVAVKSSSSELKVVIRGGSVSEQLAEKT